MQMDHSGLIERHGGRWNVRDASGLARDHSIDGVVFSPMFGRVHGREGIRATYEALFAAFPDWQLRYDPPIVDGNRLAAPFSVSATHLGEFMGLAGSGRRCSFEGVSLFVVDSDQLIAEEKRVYDFTGLLTQVGVLRIRPAP
ncbi:MAG: ester cyclase [Vicinamibacterales bacterium]